MAILDREMFLKIQNEMLGPKSELVEIVPGYEVKVVQLTAEEGLGLYSIADGDSEEERNQNGSFRWIAACCQSEDGAQVFTFEDVQKLPVRVVSKLIGAVNRVNDLAEGDSAIEEAEKNSEKTTS